MLPLLVCITVAAQVSEPDTLINGSVPDNLHSYPVPSDTANATTKDYTIRTIFITGNKKTKEKIILREVPFKSGDKISLNELVSKFEDARRLLMNTTHFLKAVVALKSFDGYNVDVLIEVRERWYLFPLPYFKFIDRNLNEWLVQNKASLDRVNYGLKLNYKNATGINDNLNVWLINGYTRQISYNYDRLYIDKKLKWGISTRFELGKNREVNYITQNNKQQFYKDETKFIRSFFKVQAEATYRRATNTRHRFGIGYSGETVNDTILKLNPSYFRNGITSFRVPELYYVMNYQDIDNIAYPLRGYLAELSFSKKGFSKNYNLWQFAGRAAAHRNIANKTWFSTSLTATVKFPFSQPYYNQRLMGYGDFGMQGYEYYVVDGVAGGYMKSTLTKQVFNWNILLPGLKYKEPYRLPINIYAKSYVNAGYIYNPNTYSNSLNNKMLYSAGIGLDIVLYYDIVLKLEWSFNQLGQNGLYLHRKSSF